MAIRKPARQRLRPAPRLRTSEEIEQFIADLSALDKEILDRRGGEPLDLDDLLDEMRGYTD